MKAKYLYLLGAVLIIADQASKIAIKLSMTIGENIPVLGDWFNIHFVENSGAAWGMELGGDYGKLILSLFRVIACIFLFIYIPKLRKKNAPKGVIIAFVLILVGALGNLIDSTFYGMIFSESTFHTTAQLVPWGEGYGTFLHGKVVDMLYFPIIETENFTFFSAIFNLADSYISIALIYMLIFERKYFNSTPQSKTKEEKDTQTQK